MDHYRLKELSSESSDRKRRKTKKVYEGNLKNHIVPKWGDYEIHEIASVEVEEWLDNLKMAPSSPAKLRNQMSTVFRQVYYCRILCPFCALMSEFCALGFFGVYAEIVGFSRT